MLRHFLQSVLPQLCHISSFTKRLMPPLPLPSAADAAATRPLVAAVFKVGDVVAGEGRLTGVGGALRPETRAKLRRTREDVAKEIEAGAARKHHEAEEEKVAARKNAYDECVAKVSVAEQQKVLDREKMRMMRKTASKVKMR